MLKRANLHNAKNIYRKYMMYDFPTDERIAYKKFKRMIKRGILIMYEYYQDGKFLGYCIASVINSALFLHYLGIIKQYRGLGLGGKVLNEIKELYRHLDFIFLEAESNSIAKNELQSEIIEKRKNFYIKNGFKALENIKYNVYFVDYDVFVYQLGNKKTTNTEIIEISRSLYKKIQLDMKYFNAEIIKNG